MLVKHSITIRSHQTSYSLEDEFYRELEIIAQTQDTSLTALITKIDEIRQPGTNLSSAIRIFILQSLKQQRRH